jgi:hypothetical protein
VNNYKEILKEAKVKVNQEKVKEVDQIKRPLLSEVV